MRGTETGPQSRPDRRSALIQLVMWGGLLASYGTALFFALRYVYPERGFRRVRRFFLAPISDLPPGKSQTYSLPDGSQALVTNTGAELVALSNVCPHLGCKVHWDGPKNRFYCPCHGGVFDSSGIAREGPPADEGKNLTTYTIQRVGRNLFLQVEEIVHS
ncbi:MAG: ubiquinol-cytochrome c reductase iron-sulfur subunit [Acidobacteriota bacterium]